MPCQKQRGLRIERVCFQTQFKTNHSQINIDIYVRITTIFDALPRENISIDAIDFTPLICKKQWFARCHHKIFVAAGARNYLKPLLYLFSFMAVVLISTFLSLVSPCVAKSLAVGKGCGAWQKGVSLNAHDLSYSKTSSAAACCELCGRNGKCEGKAVTCTG